MSDLDTALSALTLSYRYFIIHVVDTLSVVSLLSSPASVSSSQSTREAVSDLQSPGEADGAGGCPYHVVTVRTGVALRPPAQLGTELPTGHYGAARVAAGCGAGPAGLQCGHRHGLLQEKANLQGGR